MHHQCIFGSGRLVATSIEGDLWSPHRSTSHPMTLAGSQLCQTLVECYFKLLPGRLVKLLQHRSDWISVLMFVNFWDFWLIVSCSSKYLDFIMSRVYRVKGLSIIPNLGLVFEVTAIYWRFWGQKVLLANQKFEIWLVQDTTATLALTSNNLFCTGIGVSVTNSYLVLAVVGLGT